jgi:hypothetical protein
MKRINTKLYFVTFLTTLVVFSAAFFISNYINKKKTEELKVSIDKIAVDILSYETQYDLLKDSSCKNYDGLSLRSELDSLGSRLDFMESQVGEDNPDVSRLKRYYSILEIKDYLLKKRMSEGCRLNSVLVLYFYAEKKRLP